MILLPPLTQIRNQSKPKEAVKYYIMTTIMPSETILPCFIPASQNASDSKAMGGDQDFNISLEDPLDFDLLAEYLLEDGCSSNSGFTMDFR